MKRIWIYLSIAAVWFCAALTATIATGDAVYLAWAIFLPPSLALLNALRPRRGKHYVYWNRYMGVIGGMMLGLFLFPVGSGFAVVMFDLPTRVFEVVTVAGWVIFIPGFFLWFKFLFMPSWGPWRLRGRYPRMVAAAARLKKLTESYTWYFPLIRVQDKPYLVVGYNKQYLSGIGTFDEEGNFVKDEALVLTLLRCYKLATAVLHMPDSQKRAHDIESYKRTDRQMERAYRSFRENEEAFRAAGKPAYDRWKNISDFEPDFRAIVKSMIARKTWLADWAFQHGLNKLTEVSDRQLCEVEETLAKFNTELLYHSSLLDPVGADAEALLQFVRGEGRSLRLKHRGTVEEMLEALVVLRKGTTTWKEEVTEFLPLKNEWMAWENRKRMAERLAGR